MMDIFGTAVVVVLIAGPLAWRILKDRRAARAQSLKADIASAISRVFGGEPFLTVTVVPPIWWRAGKVLLSVHGGDEWVVRAAWDPIVSKVPRCFDLVVHHA
jgi:hypothetical protein